ncbi:M23 family metallopeptidase [Candidatus Woesebacteria bacterium]|nr:M23 family metallopeptidase [Candidatus Woesebacteria bacterium]
MTKISLNLLAYRLDFGLTKRRSRLPESMIPSLGKIKRGRSGSKFSRFFRHVFEHANIKKILGSTLTFAFFAGAFIPSSIFADNQILVNAQLQKPTQVNATTIIAVSSQIQTQNKPVIKAPVVLSASISGTRYPVDNILITQRYSIFHPGVDLADPVGTPVYPVLGGRVEAIQNYRKSQDPEIASLLYGNAIVINHGNGILSLYAHLSKIDVVVGQDVITSTEIGEVGATGHATGPHLHLEIRQNGQQINPLVALGSK